MRDQAIWLTVRQAMLMVCDAIERWYYLNSNGRVKDLEEMNAREREDAKKKQASI